jgi:hypothetical protein
MKGNVSDALKLAMILLVWYFVFAVTLVNGTREVESAKENAEQKEAEIFPNLTIDGFVISNKHLHIRDPWEEWQEELDRKDRERQEREARRVCGRDAHFSIVDEKCNATLLFDLPANKTISLHKHLRSHARLKRRVLTLERMMRVAMAYIKLGAAVRSGQGRK